MERVRLARTPGGGMRNVVTPHRTITDTNGEQIQIGERLGSGSHGVVYRGLHVQTSSFLAVKQVELVSEARKGELIKEIEMLASLDHPNIVCYLGTIVDDGYAYILMEYADCGTLGEVVESFGPMSEVTVAHHVVLLLRGLDYLHKRGVVHRDIKGANVMTTKDGETKLVDFGIAAKLSDTEELLAVQGSPNWMAPEVLSLQAPCSPASDIWSVGCCIIELMDGMPPYAHLDRNEVLYAMVANDRPPDPQKASPVCANFLGHCLARKPSERWTCEMLLQHTFLSGSLLNSGPTSSTLFMHRSGSDTSLLRRLSLADVTERRASSAPSSSREHTTELSERVLQAAAQQYDTAASTAGGAKTTAGSAVQESKSSGSTGADDVAGGEVGEDTNPLLDGLHVSDTSDADDSASSSGSPLFTDVDQRENVGGVGGSASESRPRFRAVGSPSKLARAKQRLQVWQNNLDKLERRMVKKMPHNADESSRELSDGGGTDCGSMVSSQTTLRVRELQTALHTSLDLMAHVPDRNMVRTPGARGESTRNVEVTSGGAGQAAIDTDTGPVPSPSLSSQALPLFHLIPAAMVLTDNRGVVQRCNEAFSSRTGYSNGALVGKNITTVIADRSVRARHDALVAGMHLMPGESRVVTGNNESCLLCQNGDILPVRVTVSQVTVAGVPFLNAHVEFLLAA